ncbi:MAG: phage tail protein [Novosphingobium sp.]
MATLVFSAVGTLVGGPLGGAIGALVGRQVDSLIIGSGHREGARLKELSATTSSFGDAIPRHFGTMRVPGSIVWATELVEHKQTQSGGKSRPSVTNYSYTASFAVVLSSRPIASIGRVWADGNLLRGAAGDLKAGGAMRLYTGERDQAADPLIAASEGANRCPAYRGLAYVVFEDLELTDFFNRIPALTFEVLADPGGFSLQEIIGSAVPDVDAALPLPGINGFSCEGPLSDTLQLLDPMFPMDCDGSGDVLTFARERLQAAPIGVAEPAVSVRDEDFGGPFGFARKRAPARASPPEVLRYYDVARDYLPGVQRASGQQRRGQSRTIELPAAMSAAQARDLAERMARRADWSREKMAWRTTELDPAIAPGAVVTLPGHPGRWRVEEWEWRDSGVELALSRVVPTGADAAITSPVDPGRVNAPADLAAARSLLAAYELPWDGTGAGDTPAMFAAVSSAQSNWKGAALFVDHGDGNLLSLGPSGRSRSILGITETALAAANPCYLDRVSSLVIVLANNDMTLPTVGGRQLAVGANRALIGREIVQFASATALGGGRWQIRNLLRGRGGTEAAVCGHAAGEVFVLLDAEPIALDPAIVGAAPATTIIALGLGDPVPVSSAIALQGITRRPLSPVHPRARTLSDGSIELGWTRRARGAWSWDDGVDVPLHEQTEAYQVTFGDPAAPVATWIVMAPRLVIDAATVAILAPALPGGALSVQQSGSYALSEPLLLTTIP